MVLKSLKSIHVYLKSIAIWVILTCTIGYFQMKYVIEIKHLQPIFFVAPIIVSTILGILTARIKLLTDELKRISIRDPLTNTFNYRYFKEVLKSWCHGKTAFSLILIDIDYFKKVNDKYGHHIGDQTLIRISKIMTDIKRSYDVLVRHGGDEFALFTPRIDLPEAADIAARLREAIREASMPSDIKLTCSFGVAQFRPDVDSADSLYERADKALYESKNKGRDCVTLETS